MKLRTPEYPAHLKNGEPMLELRDDAGELVAIVHATDRGLKIKSPYIVNHQLLVAIDPHEPPAILIDLATGMGL